MMSNLNPLANNKKHDWTNDEIRDEFLLHIMDRVYKYADESLEGIREDAMDNDPSDLRKRIVNIQLGTALIIFGLIDGVRGPTFWPGIKLVNAKTGEDLMQDEEWESALSYAEEKYLDSIDPPNNQID